MINYIGFLSVAYYAICEFQTHICGNIINNFDKILESKTGLFYIIGGGVVISLIFLIIKLREKKLRTTKDKLEKEVDTRIKEVKDTEEELRRSKSFTDSIISNAKDGIVVFSSDYKFELVNTAFFQIIHFQESDLLGTSFFRLVTEEQQQEVLNYLESLKTSKKVYFETRLLSKSNTQIPVSISASLIEEENIPPYIIAVVNDISERKKRDDELAKYRLHLETLVKERTAELLEAKEAAEKADRLKSAFLANISHEVRTPMNAIIGFTQLIGSDEISKEENEHFISEIQKNTYELLKLIDNVIEISRLEAKEVEIYPEVFSLNNFLENLKREGHKKLEENKKELDIFVEYGPPKEIKSDPVRIKKIFNILIDNAIKFTESGFIKLGYDVPVDTDDCVVFFVQDKGKGIDNENLERIFTIFNKLEAENEKFHAGSGLGLAIAKKSVMLLNGEIWVESERGEGAIFYFKIPVQSSYVSGNSEDETRQSERSSLMNKKLLIAEDEDANYRFVKITLDKYNSHVLRAKNGQEAVDICKEHTDIDVVLMDIKLPGKDGYAALHEIRDFRPDIRVIAQTAYAMAEDRQNLLQAGFDDYIAKPFRIDDLVVLIEKNID